MRIGEGCGFKNVQPNFVRGTFYIGKIDEYCTPFPKTLENAFSKDHKTSLAAEEMQLIRPTSEFKVGHLPFQGKVKGVLPQFLLLFLTVLILLCFLLPGLRQAFLPGRRVSG